MTSRLRYLPLGGLGEVGINMWALEYEGKVLVVDSGLMFPQEDMLGIDLVLPDISYLLSREREVVGIFLTHGHEDHIGGLPFTLRKLNVPVYGTRLTLGLVKPKLKEHHILREADLREVRVGDAVQLGPFRLETVAVCHSIPDAVGLAIQTPVGRVVYTSDFKLDPAPPDGHPTNMARFRALGDEGVLLLLSDSTNSERGGHSGSERDLHAPFQRIFGEAPGRIVVANFASNIHRIQHLVRMAIQFDRRIAVVGRSLQQNFKTARELGFLDVPEGLTVALEQTDRITASKLLLLTAGSQGEPMSALTRFAAQRHPLVNVRKGDWVVISARPIPGNERMVLQTVNNLYRHGARVFYSEVGNVHVTGHAHRDELREMLDATRPKFFIPVHGEYRQLLQHSEVAREAGMAEENVIVVEDGESVELDADSITRGEKITTGLVYVDGLGVGDVEEVVLRDRRHLAEDGILVVTLTIDRDTGVLRAGPDLVSRGV
ncbi:MAG TPA: ribonuclease J, partial [Candidatus Dormibacteraeota bacterium]|nr:ribonuclease J [Candidatus Dormibacteraeota bacterium]